MQEAEKRLRDIVTGKKPSGALAVNGTAARKMGGKQRQQLFVFTVRLPLWSAFTSTDPVSLTWLSLALVAMVSFGELMAHERRGAQHGLCYIYACPCRQRSLTGMRQG